MILGILLCAAAGTAIYKPWHVCRRGQARGFEPMLCSCGGGERTPASYLKTLTVAQVDFRFNDRDGDKIENFWRGDVAGLYALRPLNGDDPIRLIEISVAAADDRPLWDNSRLFRPAPLKGYSFRTLRQADEKGIDPNRFAFCAFPIDYPKSGRKTFVVNEGNTIFMRDLGRPGGIEVFPADEELRTRWAKID